jgi:6-phosphogluconolactonase
MIEVTHLLKKYSISNHSNEGITIANVANADAGIELSKRLLYELVDPRTTMYLSGGRTPKALYEQLAQDEQIKPGAVGIVDERFGTKFHGNSNEKMIRETGLQRYLEILDIPYYPILQNVGREETAQNYDEKVRHLNAVFPQSVAILGIGADGHTSSIAPNRKDFHNPMFTPDQSHLLVSAFNDPKSFYGERVGMTFLGLSMLDVLLVLIFGDDKKEALEEVFTDGKEEEIPARFFKRPDIAKKTLFITDQNV